MEKGDHVTLHVTRVFKQIELSFNGSILQNRENDEISTFVWFQNFCVSYCLCFLIDHLCKEDGGYVIHQFVFL